MINYINYNLDNNIIKERRRKRAERGSLSAFDSEGKIFL